MDLRSLAALEFSSNSIIHPSMPRPLQKFYRGKPMALGIIQILIGILEIALGLAAVLAKDPINYFFHFTTPYWMGSLYIISGSLSVSAAKDPRIPLVKCMLGMNILSAVGAGVGIVMFSFLVSRTTYYTRMGAATPYNGAYPPVMTVVFLDVAIKKSLKWRLCFSSRLMHYVAAILLAFTILEFLIAVTSAGFGCSSMCRNAYNEMTVVVFQKTAEAASPAVPVPAKEDEAS
ncbi:membrane-spanning 4-domains subfamily A member 8-like [Eublepharis macularius]|uniref:Membrane-spanning 4-domains subfamily A member 8-like n=1 Tax=Eublepharis macularius TaxID=481883 RepID=A0AA97LGJ4_EUBMA|nr:membrane-spanning 4-domains subfamily A member 8-like [Eublepharis macularius]